MKILNASAAYEKWVISNQGASRFDKLIVRSLLATNDVATTLFITEAPFDHVTRMYSTLAVNEIEEIKTSDHKVEDDVKESGTKTRLDRKRAISFVASNLEKGNAGLKILKTRYNMLDLLLPDGKVVKAKVVTSRDYKDEVMDSDNICCSWSKEDYRNITTFDYHLYAVEWGDSYKTLIFSTDELQRHLSKKLFNNNFVNYYFRWKDNGKVIDVRDTALPIDVTVYDTFNTEWKIK